MLNKLLALACLTLSFGANASTIAISTFDTDLDGWHGVIGETTNIEHRSVGGNPGGYAWNDDLGSTGGNILAPAEFLGDWSSLDGVGELSWDFNLFFPGTVPIK